MNTGQVCLTFALCGSGWDDETFSQPRVLRVLGRQARGRRSTRTQRSRAGSRAPSARRYFRSVLRRAAGFPFRVAGTRLCALLGKDAKGAGFADYFTKTSRREFEDVVGIVAEETLPTVGGITAEGADGSAVHLELLLLPFSTRSHSPLSLTGLIVPIGRDDAHAYAPLKNFTLTSWRYAAEAQKWRGSRAARKWNVMRGFTVYEGLR